MRNPRNFAKPLAIGAPNPPIDIPMRPSRMIHFFDPSNPRMAAKVPQLVDKVDVLLANLEDAIRADKKTEAREGLIGIARNTNFGDAQFWVRINSLDSPWGLDDLLRIVVEVGAKIDVIMVPKVEGPWDIHYVDQLLAQLEAKAELERIVDDFNSTPAEAAKAAQELEQIGMEFAAASLAEFEARTKFLNGFVAGLQKVIDSSEENPVGTALDNVTGNVQALAAIAKKVKELLG